MIWCVYVKMGWERILYIEILIYRIWHWHIEYQKNLILSKNIGCCRRKCWTISCGSPVTRTRTRTGHYTCQVQRQIKCLDSSTLIFSNVLKCIYLFHKSLETLWLMMGTAYEDNLCLKSITILAAVDFLTLLYSAGVASHFAIIANSPYFVKM